MQWSAGLVEPALGAVAVLCSLIARLLPVLSHSGVVTGIRDSDFLEITLTYLLHIFTV